MNTSRPRTSTEESEVHDNMKNQRQARAAGQNNKIKQKLKNSDKEPTGPGFLKSMAVTNIGIDVTVKVYGDRINDLWSASAFVGVQVDRVA